MPEFKDISEFEVVQPTGTEKIQVSASGCIELISLVEVLGQKTRWYKIISRQIRVLNGSVFNIQTKVVNLTSQVSTLESNLTKNSNKLSIVENWVRLINNIYLLCPSYKCVDTKVEQIKVTGNTVLYLDNRLWDIDTTIIIDVDNWGAGTGALGVIGFSGPNFSSSKIISGKPLKFTTNNHQMLVFGNINEVESEMSNLTPDNDFTRVVYDIIPFKHRNNSEPPKGGYQFMIIGKVITANLIQESYNEL